MLKTILIMILITINSYSDVIDSLKKEVKNEIFYIDRFYPIDNTCSKLDLKKFITITRNQLQNKKNRPFTLDLCSAFKEIYNLNEELKKEKSSINVGESFNYLIQENPNSFYVNFYAYLVKKEYKVKRIKINYDIFEKKEDDFSKYIQLEMYRKEMNDRKRKYREDYYKRVFREGKDLLSSRHNIIYKNVYLDLLIYFKKYNKDNYENFITKIIKENKKRELSNKYLNLELAEYLFNENYLDLEALDQKRILTLLKKSYEEGYLFKQELLFNKINVINEVNKFIKNYPKYMSDIEEYDLLMKSLKNIKKYEKIIGANQYYYLIKYKAFVYEKIIYIKNEESIMKGLIKSLRILKQIEPKNKDRRRIQRKLDSLISGTFFN